MQRGIPSSRRGVAIGSNIIAEIPRGGCPQFQYLRWLTTADFYIEGDCLVYKYPGFCRSLWWSRSPYVSTFTVNPLKSLISRQVTNMDTAEDPIKHRFKPTWSASELGDNKPGNLITLQNAGAVSPRKSLESFSVAPFFSSQALDANESIDIQVTNDSPSSISP